jgi:DNA-binding MarR family transcriptional regulator
MTNGADASGHDRRRLADELLDELTAIKPRDRHRMLQAWQRSGVSIVQLSAVNLLEADGPMTMGRLAESLGISVASATGVVDRMEERHLVVRRPDADDRRLVIVHAAEGAAELFLTMERVRRDHLAQLVGQLSDEELTGLLTGLRALRAARERLEAGEQ